MRLYEVTGKKGKYSQYQFEVGEYVVHLYFEASGPVFQRLDEGRRKGNIELGGQYSAAKHSGHIPGGKTHLHIFAGQDQIAAANFDGTGHDGYSGTRLPNRVAQAISDLFPNFRLPKDNILESASKAVLLLLKLEF